MILTEGKPLNISSAFFSGEGGEPRAEPALVRQGTWGGRYAGCGLLPWLRSLWSQSIILCLLVRTDCPQVAKGLRDTPSPYHNQPLVHLELDALARRDRRTRDD